MREFGSVRRNSLTASTIWHDRGYPFYFVFLVSSVGQHPGNCVWVLVLLADLDAGCGVLSQKKAIQLTQKPKGRRLNLAAAARGDIRTGYGQDQRQRDRVLRLWTELNTLSSVNPQRQRKLASFLTFLEPRGQQATYVAAGDRGHLSGVCG